MNRWKMKAELVDLGREINVVVAEYDEGGKPVQRHTVKFGEHATSIEIAEQLRVLANALEVGS